jgi:hypothetical protein
MNLLNPFDKYEAEEYDVESVYEMFVDDKTIIDEFCKPRHHFIWGARGSGKSMLLRFFEPYCQLKKYNGWDNFFNSPTSFIGIYCPIPRGLLDDEKFRRIDSFIADILSSHLFNMLVSESMLRTICEQLKNVSIEESSKIDFSTNFIHIIDAKEDHVNQADQCFNRLESPLEWVYEFIKQEKRRVLKYIQFSPFTHEAYKSCLTDYHDFILPFTISIKKLLNYSNSIYIMFDDAGFLCENIQKKINSWISNRNHVHINIKVASEQLYYKSFLTNDGQVIERINDFEDIYLDWKETTVNKEFENNTFEIAEKRLKLFGMGTTNIKVLFPEDNEQVELLLEARRNIAKDMQSSNKEYIKDKDRYINRVSIHLFHKMLSEKRLSRCYSGYNDIVNLSFGNIRSFLRLSRFIIDAAKSRDELDKIKSFGYHVDPNIQNTAINNFSKKEFEDIKSFKPGEQQNILDGLHTLINSLCEFFKYRLKNMPLVESAVTAFAIKNIDELNEESKNILRTAIRYRYFIRKTYKTKNGLGREEVYAINKLLLPAYNLEPLPFSGRIVLTQTVFELACTNRDLFLATVTKKEKFAPNMQQLNLFDMFDISEDREEELDEYNENDLSRLY